MGSGDGSGWVWFLARVVGIHEQTEGRLGLLRACSRRLRLVARAARVRVRLMVGVRARARARARVEGEGEGEG